MGQLSFEFDAPRERRPQGDAAIAARALTPEEMAQKLDTHPDYEVRRRLVPVPDYGPAPDTLQAVCRVLILDTETTGLSHASDRIIELAMLRVSVDTATGLPFGPVETFEGFDGPGMPIPEIAHNTGFDRPFMEARFPALPPSPGPARSPTSIGRRRARNRPSSARLRRTAAGSTTRTARWSTAMRCCRCSPLALRSRARTHSRRAAIVGMAIKVWGRALDSEDALHGELAWFRAEVYGRRKAQIEVEMRDALTRYASRSGVPQFRALPDD